MHGCECRRLEGIVSHAGLAAFCRVFDLSVKTENLNAISGAEFLIEKLKIYNISIVHETWIQNVCDAIEENERRKK